MRDSKHLVFTIVLIILLVFVFGVLTSSKVAAASVCNWNGSEDGDWTNVDNWDIVSGCSGVPGDHVDVVFPITASNKNIVNVPDDLIVQSIAFDGDYSITGTDITLEEGVTSTSLYVQIYLNITLGMAQTLGPGIYNGNIVLNGHDLDFNSVYAGIAVLGTISGNGNITVTDTANHPVNFGHSNTFVGDIDVFANGFALTADNALGNAANVLTMHSGAGGLFLYGTSIPNDIVLNDSTTIDNVSGNSNLSGDITIANATPGFGVESGTLTLSGALLGSANAEFYGGINFTGDGSAYTGSLSFLYGTTYINGDVATGVTLVAGGGLGGSGSVGGITAYTGWITPGNSPGILTVTGDMALTSADTLVFELNGTTVGNDYDQIQVGGTAYLSDAVLSISTGFSPAGGTTFVIIDAGFIAGTFSGLPDGSVVHVGGEDFIIHYTATQVTLGAVGGQISIENSSFTANPTTPTTDQSITITVVWGSNFQVPTGTAELFDGSTSLGIVTLSGGNSIFNISGLSAGNHTLTAVYSGDLLHDGITSDPLVLGISTGLATTGISVPVVLLALLGIFSAIAGVYFYKLAKPTKRN